MSAMPLALLLTTAAATAVGAAALHAAHGLRKQVVALREDLAAARREHGADRTDGYVSLPQQARSAATPAAEIRAAVAEALAEERERELAEARAFWAAQEARDAADAPSPMLGGLAGLGEDAAFFLPRQADFAGLEAEAPGDGRGAGDRRRSSPRTRPSSPRPAAATPRTPTSCRSRRPSSPTTRRTVSRLEELAESRTALADVRPGPLGTLDVYVFADGTTLCMTPGHRETSERLAGALRDGDAPVLLGGSGVSGAYALTFSCGEESVYILADRVIASL